MTDVYRTFKDCAESKQKQRPTRGGHPPLVPPPPPKKKITQNTPLIYGT